MKLWRRRSRSDDAATVEVIGFILAFALSSVLLVYSTQAFMRSQETTDHVVAGVELRAVANRVSTRILQAGIIAEDFPNATYTLRVRIPEDTVGRPYQLNATEANVTASLVLETLATNATTYKLDALDHLYVDGGVYSSAKQIEVTYNFTRWMNTDVAVDDGAFPWGAQHVYRYITISQVG